MHDGIFLCDTLSETSKKSKSGWTAQIVLHEMDHLEGIII